MTDGYHDGSRALQDRFDTRRLADRLHSTFRSTWTLEEVRPFLEAAPMFFLATADRDGHPQCSYKGGAPGFVQILAPMELCFPNYDGNGMYLSMGNIGENPSIQMLFIDFEQPNRVRVSGQATLTDDPDVVGRYPGAQFAVHVAVTDVFPNCPRYIHRTASHQLSPNVPAADGTAPIAEWKCMPMFNDVLAADDPARGIRHVSDARLSRRAFLALGATVVVGACSSGDDDAAAPDTAAATTDAEAVTTVAPTTAPAPTTTPLGADPFLLGVTAGDPDAASVVLWTRLVGDLPDHVDVLWELAPDETFADISAAGTVTATAADGHSVHVVADVDGPVAYRFRAGGFTSPVGRAAPALDGTSLKLAAATCQHWETGYYAAHRDLVEWAPDAVVFLGDFIYEGVAQPVGDGRVRSHDGAEPTDLAGYRDRYAQYLSDPDLQAARAACPWFVIWDDHEVENNYAALEPQDPADREQFAARRSAAYQVWWEHMPVRIERPVAGAETTIYRSASYGDLVDLVLLDGRQFRSDQACGDTTLSIEPACPEALDPTRTMLGTAQEAWLGETFAASSATWAVLGQQTVLTDLRLPTGGILNYDQWDGYAPARDRLLAAAAPVAGRMVVLTGDIHLAGVGLLPGIGTEFVTTSISSGGDIPPVVQPILASFDTIVDAELVHRGYTRHTVSATTWTAEYRIVADVNDPASAVSTWHTFTVSAGASDAVAVA